MAVRSNKRKGVSLNPTDKDGCLQACGHFMPVDTQSFGLPTELIWISEKEQWFHRLCQSSVRSSFGGCLFPSTSLERPETNLICNRDKGICWFVVIFMKILPCAKCIVLYVDILMITHTATPKIDNPPICQWEEWGSEDQVPCPRSHSWWESESRLEGRSAWHHTQPLTRDGHPAGHIHSAVPSGRSV